MRFGSVKSYLVFIRVLEVMGFRHPFNNKDWEDFFNNYCGVYISKLNFTLDKITNNEIVLDINNKYKLVAKISFVKFNN